MILILMDFVPMRKNVMMIHINRCLGLVDVVSLI